MKPYSFWEEHTAAAALLAGIVVCVAGLAIMLEFHAYLVGAVIMFPGALAACAAILAYRC